MVIRFIIPGAIMAAIGAVILTKLSDLPILVSYTIGTQVFEVETIKLVLGSLIFLFAFLELVPSLEARIKFDKKYLPLGGALSGFFGCISGHQGALRSAVLLKCGLEKEAFIATGVVCAVVVDFSRLIIYGSVACDLIFVTAKFQPLKQILIYAYHGVFWKVFVQLKKPFPRFFPCQD